MRDVIQHLPINIGVKIINSIRESGIKYALITTYDVPENKGDIKSGDFYRNNLEKPPFNLGNTLQCDIIKGLKRLCLFNLNS